MVVTGDVNRELRELWREVIDSGAWPDELPKLWPLQYQHTIDTPALVFVGMNPAYALRDERRAHERPVVDTDLLLNADGRADLCNDKEYAPAPYFRPFGRFIEHTRLQRWAHLDMFAVRHTDQNDVKRALGLDADWTDFAVRQFDIFAGLLAQIDPPVIVVPNAYASHKMHERFGMGEMSTEHGCHFLALNGREIPVFLSGMLTGQRAMDVYSHQRLLYQVRRMIQSLGF